MLVTTITLLFLLPTQQTFGAELNCPEFLSQTLTYEELAIIESNEHLNEKADSGLASPDNSRSLNFIKLIVIESYFEAMDTLEKIGGWSVGLSIYREIIESLAVRTARLLTSSAKWNEDIIRINQFLEKSNRVLDSTNQISEHQERRLQEIRLQYAPLRVIRLHTHSVLYYADRRARHFRTNDIVLIGEDSLVKRFWLSPQN